MRLDDVTPTAGTSVGRAGQRSAANLMTIDDFVRVFRHLKRAQRVQRAQSQHAQNNTHTLALLRFRFRCKQQKQQQQCDEHID